MSLTARPTPAPGAAQTALVPRPGDGRLAGRALAILFWVGLPLLCLVFLVVGGLRIADHLNNTPAGIRGSYLVTTRSCQQQLCLTGGTFMSNDRSVLAADLLGDYRWQLGTEHEVVYNANAADVIPLPAHWDPSGTAVGMAAMVLLLGIWVTLGRRSRWAWFRTPDRSRAHSGL